MTITVFHVLRRYHPDYWGGTESAVLSMALGLRKSGIESVFWAPRIKDPINTDNDLLTLNGFTVKRYQSYLATVGISKADKAKLIAIGGNIISFELYTSLIRGKPHLIHSHALGRIGAIACSAANALATPFVLHIHGGYLERPKRPCLQRVSSRHTVDFGKVFGLCFQSRSLLERSDLIIALNQTESKRLLAHNPERHVAVIPNSLGDADYAKSRGTSSRPKERYALFLGRISPEKNLQRCVSIAKKLIQQNHIDQLIIAGSNSDLDYKMAVQEFIESNSMAAVTVSIPPVKHNSEQWWSLYKNATITINSSDSETFGLSIIESLACGVPALCIETSGAKDIAEQYAACHIIPRYNYETGWVGLSKLEFKRLSDCANREQAVVALKYHSDTVSRNLASQYRRLLKRYA